MKRKQTFHFEISNANLYTNIPYVNKEYRFFCDCMCHDFTFRAVSTEHVSMYAQATKIYPSIYAFAIGMAECDTCNDPVRMDTLIPLYERSRYK